MRCIVPGVKTEHVDKYVEVVKETGDKYVEAVNTLTERQEAYIEYLEKEHRAVIRAGLFGVVVLNLYSFLGNVRRGSV